MPSLEKKGCEEKEQDEPLTAVNFASQESTHLSVLSSLLWNKCLSQGKSSVYQFIRKVESPNMSQNLHMSAESSKQ